MSKWEDNKWKIFWSWVILWVFAVTISVLYRSERSKRIELEAELSGHICKTDTVFIGLGDNKIYFSPIDTADTWDEVETLKTIIRHKDILLSIWAGEYPNKKIYKTHPIDSSLKQLFGGDSIGVSLNGGQFITIPLHRDSSEVTE